VADISLLVIHNISLPPGEFDAPQPDTPYIDDFFGGDSTVVHIRILKNSVGSVCRRIA
jgi:hypothetical protein